MEELFRRAILSYGILPVLRLQERYERDEWYEVCKAIQSAIATFNDSGLPKRLTDEVEKDILAEYWRLGFSGDIWANSLMAYEEMIDREVMAHKLLVENEFSMDGE